MNWRSRKNWSETLTFERIRFFYMCVLYTSISDRLTLYLFNYSIFDNSLAVKTIVLRAARFLKYQYWY